MSQKYYVSFKVSRADSNYVVGYSTNKIGAKMSTKVRYNAPINNTAHFHTETVISDTAKWVSLFGSFIADSAYKYIMLGNFFDNSNTTVVNYGNGNIAYYYIDEVCVSTDSLFAANYGTGTGINKDTYPNKIHIYPNPAANYINITGVSGGDVSIFDTYGQPIDVKKEIKNGLYVIDCSKWATGIYFVQIGLSIHKLIINRKN